MQGLLTGGIPTPCIDTGNSKIAQAQDFRPWTPILKAWVQGIISTDADTEQNQKARRYLTELASAGASAKLSRGYVRTEKYMLQLIQVLMGSEPSEKDKEIYPAYRQFGRRKVFSTLSAGVASVGLAAAANGADVSVECISRNNDREVTVFLPRDGHPSRQSTFVIRLWLCTPPFSFYVRPREYDGAENELRDDYATLIIYGGDREIALSAARELDFWDAQAFDHGKHERDVVALWQDGVAAGLDLKWRVKSPQPKQKDSGLAVNTSPKLRLQLEHPPRETIKGGYVDQLASVLTRHRKGLEPIARKVAAIIDNVYGYLNYVEGKDAELFSAATQFVLIALAVGTLKSLTRLPGNDFSYALNLGSLTIRGEFAAQLGTGELLRLPESALGQGVMPSELL